MKFATKVLPSRQSLEAVHSAGFRAVEFWTSAELLSAAGEISAIAREFELEYVIHFPNGGKLTQELLQNIVALYNELSCRAMVIHAPMHRRYSEHLLRLQPSLRLGVENLKLTPPQFEAWAVEQPWLTLDVEHLWKFTLNDAPLPQLLDALANFLQRHSHKLVHVHLPGYLPGHDEHRPMYCSREMVLAVVSLLEEAGYGEFVVSEVDPEYQTEHDLKMDLLLTERWRQIHAAAMPAAASAETGM